MRAALIAIGLAVILLGIGPLAFSVYTANKIQRMRMVLGEIPGARFVKGTVERKWVESNPNGNVNWLEVRHGSARVDVDRENVGADVWSRLRVGDPIRVALLPDGDAVLPEGIWASPGNLAFNRGLLVVERIVTGLVFAIGVGMCAT